MENKQEGIVFGMRKADYLSSPGVSNSQLKYLARSPAHLKAKTHEETPSTLDGSIIHQLVFEPDEKHWWSVKPEGMKLSTKDGKAWKAEQLTEAILSQDEWASINGAANAVNTLKDTGYCLSSGTAEVSVFRIHEPTGVLRKGRMDWVSRGSAIIDLKTTEDAQEWAFAAQVKKLKWNIQGAYYLDLWNDSSPQKKEHFIWIAVEKEPPFAFRLYSLSQSDIEAGREEYNRLLHIYAQCEKLGEWPGYTDQITELILPKWGRTTNDIA